MIIDFRLRPPTLVTLTRERLEFFARSVGFTLSPSYLKSSVDLLLEEMDEGGVTMGVVVGRKNAREDQISPDNEDIAKFVDKYPKRFVGIAGIDTTDLADSSVKPIKDAERAIKELGLKGIAIEPQVTSAPMSPDDRRLYPLYEKCVELGVPLLSNVIGGPGSYDPLVYDKVASTFPKLKIVCVHAGWPLVDSALAVAWRRSNFYLEPDHYLNYNMPSGERYLQAANTFMPDRLIYGSAYPCCGTFKGLTERVKNLPFKDEETREKYLYKNAQKLLKL